MKILKKGLKRILAFALSVTTSISAISLTTFATQTATSIEPGNSTLYNKSGVNVINVISYTNSNSFIRVFPARKSVVTNTTDEIVFKERYKYQSYALYFCIDEKIHIDATKNDENAYPFFPNYNIGLSSNEIVYVNSEYAYGEEDTSGKNILDQAGIASDSEAGKGTIFNFSKYIVSYTKPIEKFKDNAFLTFIKNSLIKSNGAPIVLDEDPVGAIMQNTFDNQSGIIRDADGKPFSDTNTNNLIVNDYIQIADEVMKTNQHKGNVSDIMTKLGKDDFCLVVEPVVRFKYEGELQTGDGIRKTPYLCYTPFQQLWVTKYGQSFEDWAFAESFSPFLPITDDFYDYTKGGVYREWDASGTSAVIKSNIILKDQINKDSSQELREKYSYYLNALQANFAFWDNEAFSLRKTLLTFVPCKLSNTVGMLTKADVTGDNADEIAKHNGGWVYLDLGDLAELPQLSIREYRVVAGITDANGTLKTDGSNYLLYYDGSKDIDNVLNTEFRTTVQGGYATYQRANYLSPTSSTISKGIYDKLYINEAINKYFYLDSWKSTITNLASITDTTKDGYKATKDVTFSDLFKGLTSKTGNEIQGSIEAVVRDMAKSLNDGAFDGGSSFIKDNIIEDNLTPEQESAIRDYDVNVIDKVTENQPIPIYASLCGLSEGGENRKVDYFGDGIEVTPYVESKSYINAEGAVKGNLVRGAVSGSKSGQTNPYQPYTINIPNISPGTDWEKQNHYAGTDKFILRGYDLIIRQYDESGKSISVQHIPLIDGTVWGINGSDTSQAYAHLDLTSVSDAYNAINANGETVKYVQIDVRAIYTYDFENPPKVTPNDGYEINVELPEYMVHDEYENLDIEHNYKGNFNEITQKSGDSYLIKPNTWGGTSRGHNIQYYFTEKLYRPDAAVQAFNKSEEAGAGYSGKMTSAALKYANDTLINLIIGSDADVTYEWRGEGYNFDLDALYEIAYSSDFSKDFYYSYFTDFDFPTNGSVYQKFRSGVLYWDTKQENRNYTVKYKNRYGGVSEESGNVLSDIVNIIADEYNGYSESELNKKGNIIKEVSLTLPRDEDKPISWGTVIVNSFSTVYEEVEKELNDLISNGKVASNVGSAWDYSSSNKRNSTYYYFITVEDPYYTGFGNSGVEDKDNDDDSFHYDDFNDKYKYVEEYATKVARGNSNGIFEFGISLTKLSAANEIDTQKNKNFVTKNLNGAIVKVSKHKPKFSFQELNNKTINLNNLSAFRTYYTESTNSDYYYTLKDTYNSIKNKLTESAKATNTSVSSTAIDIVLDRKQLYSDFGTKYTFYGAINKAILTGLSLDGSGRDADLYFSQYKSDYDIATGTRNYISTGKNIDENNNGFKDKMFYLCYRINMEGNTNKVQVAENVNWIVEANKEGNKYNATTGGGYNSYDGKTYINEVIENKGAYLYNYSNSTNATEKLENYLKPATLPINVKVGTYYSTKKYEYDDKIEEDKTVITTGDEFASEDPATIGSDLTQIYTNGLLNVVPEVPMGFGYTYLNSSGDIAGRNYRNVMQWGTQQRSINAMVFNTIKFNINADVKVTGTAVASDSRAVQLRNTLVKNNKKVPVIYSGSEVTIATIPKASSTISADTFMLDYMGVVDGKSDTDRAVSYFGRKSLSYGWESGNDGINWPTWMQYRAGIQAHQDWLKLFVDTVRDIDETSGGNTDIDTFSISLNTGLQINGKKLSTHNQNVVLSNMKETSEFADLIIGRGTNNKAVILNWNNDVKYQGETYKALNQDFRNAAIQMKLPEQIEAAFEVGTGAPLGYVEILDKNEADKEIDGKYYKEAIKVDPYVYRSAMEYENANSAVGVEMGEGWYVEVVRTLRIVRYKTSWEIQQGTVFTDKIPISYGPKSPTNKNDLFTEGYKAAVYSQIFLKGLGASGVYRTIRAAANNVDFIVADATVNDMKFGG